VGRPEPLPFFFYVDPWRLFGLMQQVRNWGLN
jgi:hypothetical protein